MFINKSVTSHNIQHQFSADFSKVTMMNNMNKRSPPFHNPYSRAAKDKDISKRRKLGGYEAFQTSQNKVNGHLHLPHLGNQVKQKLSDGSLSIKLSDHSTVKEEGSLYEPLTTTAADKVDHIPFLPKLLSDIPEENVSDQLCCTNKHYECEECAKKWKGAGSCKCKPRCNQWILICVCDTCKASKDQPSQTSVSSAESLPQQTQRLGKVMQQKGPIAKLTQTPTPQRRALPVPTPTPKHELVWEPKHVLGKEQIPIFFDLQGVKYTSNNVPIPEQYLIWEDQRAIKLAAEHDYYGTITYGRDPHVFNEGTAIQKLVEDEQIPFLTKHLAGRFYWSPGKYGGKETRICRNLHDGYGKANPKGGIYKAGKDGYQRPKTTIIVVKDDFPDGIKRQVFKYKVLIRLHLLMCWLGTHAKLQNARNASLFETPDGKLLCQWYYRNAYHVGADKEEIRNLVVSHLNSYKLDLKLSNLKVEHDYDNNSRLHFCIGVKYCPKCNKREYLDSCPHTTQCEHHIRIVCALCDPPSHQASPDSTQNTEHSMASLTLPVPSQGFVSGNPTSDSEDSN